MFAALVESEYPSMILRPGLLGWSATEQSVLNGTRRP